MEYSFVANTFNVTYSGLKAISVFSESPTPLYIANSVFYRTSVAYMRLSGLNMVKLENNTFDDEYS